MQIRIKPFLYPDPVSDMHLYTNPGRNEPRITSSVENNCTVKAQFNYIYVVLYPGYVFYSGASEALR
jgi:hypothetical protein